MRIVSGPPWTLDGRWVVIGPWPHTDHDVILFDPYNGVGIKDIALEGPPAWASLLDLRDCFDFVRRKTC